VIEAALGERLSELGVTFGRGPRQAAEAGGLPLETITFGNWLRDVAACDFRASVILARARVEATDGEELAGLMTEVFKALFPLVRLSLEDGPIDEIFGVTTQYSA
jgi:hypothetical protein